MKPLRFEIRNLKQSGTPISWSGDARAFHVGYSFYCVNAYVGRMVARITEAI